MDPAIKQISEKLYLVTLVPPIPGFDDFICAWVVKGDPSFVVDAGPAATAGQLLKALDDLEIRDPGYILVTHIHADHAGGVSPLSDAFPGAKVVCHPKGIPHLADPARLWEGTVKTLGDIGRAYGPMTPVPKERILDAEGFAKDQITAILTPGHAPHHVSYQIPNFLFAGEAGGVFYEISPDAFYMRPATPPRFFLDVSIKSVDRLLAANPGTICYGHYGIHPDARAMLLKHRDQLLLWHGIIEQEMGRFGEEDFIQTCMDRLLAEDPLTGNLSGLSAAQQERERFFLANSIKGFALSLKALADNP